MRVSGAYNNADSRASPFEPAASTKVSPSNAPWPAPISFIFRDFSQELPEGVLQPSPGLSVGAVD